MTQEEEAITTFKSNISMKRTNSMSGSSGRAPAGQSSSSTGSSILSSKSRHAIDEASRSAVLEMGSTDSPHSARRGSGSSCGLVSSLFSNNCRGRAEAFARRLHRRLTSLGGENDSPERTTEIIKPCESSWLHPSSGSNRSVSTNIETTNHVLQRQPRHSPESDLFYDFDVDLEEEEEGLGSPAEEATAAELTHLLVHPEILKVSHHDSCHCSPSSSTKTLVHQDPESGYVYVSPINGTPPDSDSSEIFFDPESSDTERQKSEVFFDPIGTSDSELTSNLSNRSMKTKVTLNSKRQIIEANENSERICEDTSESESCSSRKDSMPCENYHRREELICSSEDSLNGKSSQETTSPSHESLWSTFDESTVSLQDESPPMISCLDLVVPRTCLPKSYSDSELPNNDINIILHDKLDRSQEENVTEHDADEIKFSNIIKDYNMEDNSKNGIDFTTKDDNNSVEKTINKETDKQESIESKTFLPKYLSQLEVKSTVASEADTNCLTCSSYGIADISNAFMPEYSTAFGITEESTLKSDAKLQIDNDVTSNGSNNEKMCLLLTKLDNSSNAKEEEKEDSSKLEEHQSETTEEEEEEGERPQRIRRCSSLKTGKTPPGTPGRKKIVRFADVLGLDLAAVRTFLDEIPRIPNSAYSDLIFQKDDIFQKDNSPVNTVSSIYNNCNDSCLDDCRCGSTSPRKVDRILMPLFQQPGGMANFLDLVRERRVCLENVLVQDPVTLAIQGTVRVINLDFHKSVHVRYTLNSWRNFSDLQATYVPNSCDGFSDKFSFVLYCHTLPIGQRLEFAIRFQCKGVQYWDNNGGANYCFQCLPSSSSTGYVPITIGESSQHNDWSLMFY